MYLSISKSNPPCLGIFASDHHCGHVSLGALDLGSQVSLLIVGNPHVLLRVVRLRLVLNLEITVYLVTVSTRLN